MVFSWCSDGTAQSCEAAEAYFERRNDLARSKPTVDAREDLRECAFESRAADGQRVKDLNWSRSRAFTYVQRGLRQAHRWRRVRPKSQLLACIVSQDVRSELPCSGAPARAGLRMGRRMGWLAHSVLLVLVLGCAFLVLLFPQLLFLLLVLLLVLDGLFGGFGVRSFLALQRAPFLLLFG
jgi:hypothetical protein